MNIEKKYVDEGDWFLTTAEECLKHTEEYGYWKTGTVLLMLEKGNLVFTPFAHYRKQGVSHE